MVRERADRLLNDLLDAATLGAFDSGAETDEDGGAAGSTKTFAHWSMPGDPEC